MNKLLQIFSKVRYLHQRVFGGNAPILAHILLNFTLAACRCSLSPGIMQCDTGLVLRQKRRREYGINKIGAALAVFGNLVM